MAHPPNRPACWRPRRCEPLVRCSSAQTALARLIETEAVEPTGHDPTTLDLLVRLDQAPGNRLRAIELSRQLLMSPSHISRTIDRAEAAGLVERGADPDDRRASQVVLTTRARGPRAVRPPTANGDRSSHRPDALRPRGRPARRAPRSDSTSSLRTLPRRENHDAPSAIERHRQLGRPDRRLRQHRRE